MWVVQAKCWQKSQKNRKDIPSLDKIYSFIEISHFFRQLAGPWVIHPINFLSEEIEQMQHQKHFTSFFPKKKSK